MSVRNVIKAIPLTTFSSASLSGTYQVVNTNGLPFPCTILNITNDNTTAVTVSFDGTTDNEYIGPTSAKQLQAQANSQPQGYASVFPVGMKVYVKGTAGTGTIALSGYYNPQGV